MLRIIDVILGLIRQVAPIADAIARKDANLARQLRDALSSAALNVAEGSYQRGARRTNHYRIAIGSTQESQTALRAAEAWGYIDPVPEPVHDQLGRVIATLVKNI